MTALVRLAGLVLAAGVTAFLYLFNQNWLHTVVFNTYVGWAYLAWLGVAGALLGDVVLNRGRVVGNVFSSLGDFSVSPC